MKFQVTEGEKYQKIIEVEIPAAEMELPIKFACKRLSEKAKVPGFRPGKIPRTVLENYLGKEAILQEACDDLLPKAYVEGLKETGIEPCAQPEAEVVSLSDTEPTCFKFTITVKPEVKLGLYKGVEATRNIIAIKDEDIDRELENMRERFAKLTDAEEGDAAAMGDTAVLDFKGMKDGVAFDGGSAENYPLSLGSGAFIPGFEEQVVGMKAGEEKNIEVTFPEQYQEKSLAGQPVVFQVKLHSIRHRVVPELDQTFVEEASESAEDMEQLRAEIRTRLEEQSKQMADRNAHDTVIGTMVDAAEIDVPPVMIEHELDRNLAEAEQNMTAQGITMEQYLQYSDLSKEQMRENMRARAEMMVRRDLALEAVIKAEAIECTDQDVEEQLQQLSATYFQPADKLRETLEKNGSMEDFRYSIKMQKAAEFVYANAVLTDKVTDRDAMMAEAAKKEAKRLAAEAAQASEEEKTEAQPKEDK